MKHPENPRSSGTEDQSGNGSAPAQTRRRRIRLVDVAEEVGVSVQVVSKVLNGGTSNVGASDSTRQRVKEAARRLGYRRHAAGMALRSQAFRSVGLLMGDAVRQNTFMPQSVLAGLTQVAAESDYTLNLMATHLLIGDAVRDSRLLNEQMVDVLVIAQANEPSDDLMESIRYMPTPVLWLHRLIEHNAVCFDEHGAAVKLVDHLAERGAKTIEYLDLNANPPESMSTSERRQGYLSACKRHNIATRTLWDLRVERQDRGEFFATWLDQLEGPQYVIIDSCSAAQVLLDVALAKGVDIPGKLNLVTFDNGMLYTANCPTITAVIFPEHELGIAAGEMAIKLAKNSQPQLPSCVLECAVAVGGSS